MLFVVSTPIGNLDDITLRAIKVLTDCDVVAAEDTRHSGILLKHLGISKPMLSYHEHNEAARTEQLITRMQQGERVALITDAGMPGISDPGVRLVRACIAQQMPYTIIPGPSAPVLAVVGSGLGDGTFFFGGFLPVKSGQRLRELTTALNRKTASVFMESPHRLVKSLHVLADLDPKRLVCVARELTKKFEEYRQGNAPDLVAHYEAHPPKGEICLVIEGAPKGWEPLDEPF